MDPQDLHNFISAQIPLSTALGAKILRADDSGAEVFAPLKPNSNHLGTAFGGSLTSVQLLACYAWLFNVLDSRGFKSHVVVMDSRTRYFKPVTSDFTVICHAPDGNQLTAFLKALERKQKARITLKSSISSEGSVACGFQGEFVALLNSQGPR